MDEYGPVELVAEGLRFPEGPIALPDGSVLLVEMFGPHLTKVHPDGRIERIAEIPGGPNGAALGPDGACYIANNGGVFTCVELDSEDGRGLLFPGPLPDGHTGGSIDRVDLRSGRVTTLYREASGQPLRAPNDLVFDRHGGIWFTDHGRRMARSSDLTALCYGKADGSSCIEAVFPTEHANGVGLSPNEDIVYWADTMTGRVHKRHLTGPGQVAEHDPMDFAGTVLAGLPGMQLLDSMGVEANGNVCVATLVRGGITVITPSGQDHHVDLGPDYYDLLTTNICWGGADMRTAYITLGATGRLVKMAWPRPGLKLNYSGF